MTIYVNLLKSLWEIFLMLTCVSILGIIVLMQILTDLVGPMVAYKGPTQRTRVQIPGVASFSYYFHGCIGVASAMCKVHFSCHLNLYWC